MFLLAQAANPTVDPPQPTPEQAEQIRKQAEAIEQFTSFHWGELDGSEIAFLAQHYGLQYGMKIALVLIILFIAWTVAGWVGSMIDTSLRRMKFDVTLTKFIARLGRWMVLLLAGLMCLSYFGIETTSFAAVIGAAGLAVGLAFQGTLSNFAAGAMLLLFRPFRVGDAVEVAGEIGVIDEISIFTTSMDTFDNKRIIIPNSEIFGSVIENITFHNIRRVDGAVGVCYDADIDHTRQILENVTQSVPGTVNDRDPAVVLLELGGSSVDWSVRVWAPTSDYATVKQALLREIKMQLDAAGIEIPFPQMDLHVRDMPNNGARAAA